MSLSYKSLTYRVLIAVSTLILFSRDNLAQLGTDTQITFFLCVIATFAYIYSRKKFQEHFFPAADALQLGWYRIVICSTLLFMVLYNDITETLQIPVEFFRVFKPFNLLISPGGIIDIRSYNFLAALHYSAAIAILFALIGLWTRGSLIFAAILYTLHYYVDVSYTHFHHLGFIPLQMLYILCVLGQCNHLSLDYSLAKGKINFNPKQVSLALYTCIALYAFSYYSAGMSKLLVRNGYWGHGDNLKRIILMDSMALMDAIPGIHFFPKYVQAGGSDLIFWIIGFSAIFIECMGISFLFSRGARLLLPLLISSLHIGILVAQKFAFVDLILLPLMFLPVGKCFPKIQQSTKYGQSIKVHRFIILPLVSAITLCALLFKREVFPICTAFGMYAYVNKSAEVPYSNVYAVTNTGKRFVTDLVDEIPFLNSARWQDLTLYPGRDDQPGIYNQERFNKNRLMLKNYAELYNSKRPDSEQIAYFEQVRKVWDTKNDPSRLSEKILAVLRYDI